MLVPELGVGVYDEGWGRMAWKEGRVGKGAVIAKRERRKRKGAKEKGRERIGWVSPGVIKRVLTFFFLLF